MTPSSKVERDRLNRLSSHLTERDRYLCRLLYDHKVLTTPQVADVGFDGRRACEARLQILHGLGIVDRFRLRADTHTPYHYTLGPAGAVVVAVERGVEVAELAWRRERCAAWAFSSRLSHLVGVNGFFTRLIAASRLREEAELAVWLSQWQAGERWGSLVRPDAYGEWQERGAMIPFLVEYDSGTERLPRLAERLKGYEAFDRAVGHKTWVLFAFPTSRREAAARRVLAGSQVAVATCVSDEEVSPAEAVWLPVGSDGWRKALIEL